MAEYNKHDLRQVAPDYKMPRGTVTYEDGLTVKKVAVATFDPSANSSQRAVAAHGLGVYLPIKAIITRVWIDVVTTFTDGDTDAATIALHLQAADDVVAAIAISDATNVWDAGIRGSKIGLPNFGADAAHDTQVEVSALFAASMLKPTAERQITATVATAALTAGKAVIFVEYVISA